jgi:hypothetical protein
MEIIFTILPLSFLFFIVEIIAMGIFLEWAYHIGIVVFRYNIDLKLPLDYQEDKLEFQTARVKFISPSKILFRSKIIIFGIRINTPFPVKGIIFEKDGKSIVEGRIPLGSTIFMGLISFSIVGGWIIGALIGESVGIFLGALVLGIVFYFIGKWSLSLEIARAKAIVDEFLHI